jgi:hypothetical protein
MKKLRALVCFIVVCFLSSPLFACHVQSSISGISTATLLDEGDHAGWYLYEIELRWDFNYTCSADLERWVLKLKDGCSEPDHLFDFDACAGYSTSQHHPCNPFSMGWSGYFIDDLFGDSPAIKYDRPYFPRCVESGPEGHGIFWFYSNVEPEYVVDKDVLAGIDGCWIITGYLTGDYPSCRITPEPATVCMLGMGSGLLLMRKK